MAHNFRTSLFAVSDRCVSSRSASRNSAIGRPAFALLAFALLLLASMVSQAQTAPSYVPSVVVSSVNTVPTTVFTKPTGTQTNVIQPISVALDACGNTYVYDHGGNGGINGQLGNGDLYTEIPAGGGTANAVENVGQYFPQNFVGQDPTFSNLIVGAGYTNHVNEFPLTGCIPQASSIKGVGNSGAGPLFYYYLAAAATGDFAGNTYISTSGTCCITGSYYLIESVGGGQSQILLANQAKEITNIAIDMQQNVYFIAGGILYELTINPANSAQPYAATPIAFGNFSDPVGISFDKVGNFYVADLGTTSLYEIPNEATGLNLADQFVVASHLSLSTSPAVSSRGDVYFIDQKQQYVSDLTLGNANFNAVPIGSTVTRTINFQFNASVTPATIQIPTGVFSSAAAPLGTVNCVAGTPYGPTGTANCQITIAFTPNSVGKQTSSVVLADASGNALATAYLQGVGQGPLITVDPGTQSQLGSGFKAPAGVAVDHAGNTFIADALNNVITEIPVGGGTAVNLAIQTASPATPLSGPLGVAVDGAGNLYVADTGNNRVVEAPLVNGAYAVSAAVEIATGLNKPSGVFVRGTGDLYVADTGDNTIVLYPNSGLKFGAAQNLGTALNAPLAVTADAFGNLYIADSGNNQIVELPNGAGQETVYANILNPSALATDSSGALFAVDQGNLRVLRIPSVNGALNTNAVAEVALNVANPFGIALDPSANLYVTDQTNAAAYTFARSQIALSFGDLAVGTNSGTLPLTVESAGNQPLVFSTPYFTESGNAGDFIMTSPTGACADGVTLAAGTSCDLATSFTPSASGARSAVVTFSANDAVPSNVTLSGNGVAAAATTTKLALVTASSGAPFYGEPLTLTATITPAGSTAPTGSASFVVDGVQAGLIPLVSGVATLSLNSGLSGGNHSVYAVYKGDTANNGSTSAAITIAIARAPTTTTLAVTTVAYNEPYSLRHSNAGSCDVLGAIRNVEFGFPALASDGVAFLSGVSSPGVGVPSGTLTFYSDGVLINAASAIDPKTNLPSITSSTTLLPAPGGLFQGAMSSTADLLGDGDMLGENNILVGPHNITVVYSGDTNYLPSTSVGTLVTVVDVSPTTPVTLPNAVVGAAPYCTATSPITTSAPSVPGTYAVAASANTIPVTANQPGQAVLTISSLGGWQGTISFACPDLPKYTTCTTNPGVATINSSTTGNIVPPSQVLLTITTNVPPSIPTASQSGFLWPAATAFGLLLLVMRRRVKRIQAGLAVFGVALLFIGGMAGLSSCGSGTKNIPAVLTPAGSYPITVVMTGAEPTNLFQQPGVNNGDTEETMKPNLPYSVPFTLIVK